ncbi:hypothetical protein Moror_13503 [Moniliophthora roreri MCA 2997]|uniref:Uncharacterized protein n=1 Tax=Moniliophthora roreri (strain MCA 2997) TaxID=1381753 RepID=V2WTF8_MONRO|nr:hypothetical protein Moror_13503 [Moniliophthora roreri MCA 2997]
MSCNLDLIWPTFDRCPNIIPGEYVTLGYKSSDDFARRVSDTGVGDSHNVLVYILLFGFTTFILSMFWPLIRLQYPCITIADLEAKEKKVYGLFQGAVKEGILVGQTMANMEMKQIELEFSDPDEKPRNGIVDVIPSKRRFNSKSNLISGVAAMRNSKDVPRSQSRSQNTYNMTTRRPRREDHSSDRGIERQR